MIFARILTSLCCPVGAVVKHFDDFQEDQFDFHAYCVRKVTLRAYTEVLRFEDNLWGEDYYFIAADGIVRICLHLSDNPWILEEDKEPDYSKMTAAERKKAKAVARKKRIQAEKKAAEKDKTESVENGSAKKGKTSPVDEDPEGKELLKLDPLEEAKKYSSILSKHCPKRFVTWTLQYDVAIRRKKWLLALQSLYKMRSLDTSDAGFFTRLVDFALKVPVLEGLSGPAKVVLSEEFPSLLKGQSIKDFVAGAAKQVRGGLAVSLLYRVAVAEALVKTELESASAAASLIVEGGLDVPGVTVESCASAMKSMEGLGPEANDPLKQWKAMVQGRFPVAADLKS